MIHVRRDDLRLIVSAEPGSHADWSAALDRLRNALLADPDEPRAAIFHLNPGGSR